MQIRTNELLFPMGPDYRWLLFLGVRYNSSGLAICVPFGIGQYWWMAGGRGWGRRLQFEQYGTESCTGTWLGESEQTPNQFCSD